MCPQGSRLLIRTFGDADVESIAVAGNTSSLPFYLLPRPIDSHSESGPVAKGSEHITNYALRG